MSFPCTELLLFNYAKVETVLHYMAPLIQFKNICIAFLRYNHCKATSQEIKFLKLIYIVETQYN